MNLSSKISRPRLQFNSRSTSLETLSLMLCSYLNITISKHIYFRPILDCISFILELRIAIDLHNAHNLTLFNVNLTHLKSQHSLDLLTITAHKNPAKLTLIPNSKCDNKRLFACEQRKSRVANGGALIMNIRVSVIIRQAARDLVTSKVITITKRRPCANERYIM